MLIKGSWMFLKVFSETFGVHFTKMKFSFKGFLSKFEQIRLTQQVCSGEGGFLSIAPVNGMRENTEQK